MAEYLSPGVYVEEKDAGPVPIEGVSTSTCGAVGVTLRGPTVGKPQLVTSYTEFVRTFGGVLPEPSPAIKNKWGDKGNPEGGTFWQFPLSVKGFFDNGGQRLFVKRVFSSTAVAASNSWGKGLVAEIEQDSPDGQSLKLNHLFGIAAGTIVTVFVDNQPQAPSTVDFYDPNTRVVTLKSGLGKAIKAGRDFVEVFARSVINPQNQQIPVAEIGLTLSSKAPGTWANALQARIRPMTGAVLKLLNDTTLPDQQSPTTVVSTSYPPATVKITVQSAAGFAVADHVLINGVEYVINFISTSNDFTLQAVGGNTHIDPKITSGMSVEKKQIFNPPKTTVTATTPFQDSDWVITVAGAVNYLAGDDLQIQDGDYPIKSIAGNAITLDPDPTKFSRANPWGVSFPTGTVVRKRRRANTKGVGVKFQIPGANQLYLGAVVELDNGLGKERFSVVQVSGNTVWFNQPPTQQYFEGDQLRLIEIEVTAQYGDQSEIFQDLPFTGNGQDLAKTINSRAQLITVQVGAGFPSADLSNFPTIPGGVASFNSNFMALAGGDDDLGGLKVDDFVGIDGGSGKRTGIQALEDIDEIALCVVPGMWAETVQTALIDQCELLRYRFAILDPPDGESIDGIRAVREPFDTKFAALYYPWIRVRDPLLDQSVDLAPSGHIAGIYARVDNDRGVYKAPANEVIQGIDLIGGLAQDVNKREQDLLNPNGINALRFFTNRGQRVWGARTLSSNAAWKYINVKRLFIFVEHSLDKGTQWVVFEPNDENTWARVRQSITNFLTTVWIQGALQGAKPEEAFFVKVDLTTMTQDDIDNGRMIILIGIAPVKPAEFVIIRIQQKTLAQKAP
jgi:phage tail sheath protein FI